MTQLCYVYVYYRDETPFYVGMGHGDRDLQHWNHVLKRRTRLKNDHLHNVLAKLKKENQSPTIVRVAENLSREQAAALEIELIAKYGRSDLGLGSLTNKTNGGDGVTGWSVESKQNLSNKKRGKVNVVDQFGNKFSVPLSHPEFLDGTLKGQNLGIKYDSKKQVGYIQAKDTDGNVFRVRNDDPRWISGELVGIQLGKKLSDATKSKMSEAQQGVPKPKPPDFAFKMKEVARKREEAKRQKRLLQSQD